MDSKDRGFQEICVSICSSISGQARFPPKDNPTPPRPVLWRNNLTALSQYYNLLFVAYAHNVHVYQPAFPSQHLSSPKVILTLPTTRSGLVGYLDPSKPHAVNHLVVADLGNQEIVVCACDDGDVLAYRTRQILDVITGQDFLCSAKSQRSPHRNISAFFHTNVGASAWGLAIHKEARLIAVSSNTQKINIFAFALHQRTSLNAEGDSESDNDEWSVNDADEEVSNEECNNESIYGKNNRSVNLQIELNGHKTNIPSIAFCNTQDDKDGKYLLSTDISGEVLIWDIWKQAGIFRHSLASLTLEGRLWNNGIGSRTCGWGVLCLDPRSFRITKGKTETFGCQPDGHHGLWDISESRSLVQDSQGLDSGFAMTTSSPNASADTVDVDDDNDVILDEYRAEDQNDDDETNENEDEDEEEGADIEEDTEDMENPGSSEGSSMSLDAVTTLPQENSLVRNSFEQAQHQSNSPAAQNQTERPDRVRRVISQTVPQVFQPIMRKLPFSMLHSSETEISFFHDPLTQPSIIMRDPLHEKLSPDMYWLGRYDRMNMVAQVPELGLVLAASPVGRVALFTLTRRKVMQLSALRLDWILPLYSQEKNGERPRVPLLGIAVGPIQGRQLATTDVDRDSPDGAEQESWRAVECSRRYRLLLMYCDNSVLSYELARQPGRSGRDETDVDELLVF